LPHSNPSTAFTCRELSSVGLQIVGHTFDVASLPPLRHTNLPVRISTKHRPDSKPEDRLSVL
jgi:hypothetical protein